MPYPLEVPVFSPHSASRAVAQGAARVELNRAGSYPEGGLTPTVADLEALLVTPSSSSSGVPVRVMIRPRGPPPPSSQEGGVDFVYTEAEFDEMKASILAFRNAAGLMRVERGDGFVFGCLRKGEKERGEGDGEVALEVDVEGNKELVQLARPFPAVFHRAFDDILGSNGAASCVDQALADLRACGFHGLLTSGGPGAAVDHGAVLAHIITAAGGKGGGSLREVVVGGGVRSTNVGQLRQSLLLAAHNMVVPGAGEEDGLAVWFHSSCLTGTQRRQREGEEEDIVDEGEVREIVRALG